VSGPEAVRVLREAIEDDGTLRVVVLANEGLILRDNDGVEFVVEVTAR